MASLNDVVCGDNEVPVYHQTNGSLQNRNSDVTWKHAYIRTKNNTNQNR